MILVFYSLACYPLLPACRDNRGENVGSSRKCKCHTSQISTHGTEYIQIAKGYSVVQRPFQPKHLLVISAEMMPQIRGKS